MKPSTAALSAFARPSKFAFVAAIASACARLAALDCSAGSARNGPLLPTAPRSGRTSTGTACGSIRAAPSGARLSWRSGGERSNATGSTKRAALGETAGKAAAVVCERAGGAVPHSDSSAMLQTSSRWFIESLLDQARSARAINLGGPSALFYFDLGMRGHAGEASTSRKPQVSRMNGWRQKCCTHGCVRSAMMRCACTLYGM